MRDHGIPYPDILIWGAIALELGGGLMLVAGLYARWVARALFFYTLSLALIFYPYWTASDPAVARTEASSFFGHLSMMGGMLFVVAFGAGAYSVDALMNRPWTGSVALRVSPRQQRGEPRPMPDGFWHSGSPPRRRS